MYALLIFYPSCLELVASKGLVNLILGPRLTSYCCRFEGKINREHMIYGKVMGFIELHTHCNVLVCWTRTCDCGSHLVPVIALMIDGLRRNMWADVESNDVPYILHLSNLSFYTLRRYLLRVWIFVFINTHHQFIKSVSKVITTTILFRTNLGLLIKQFILVV